ncbi:hypothetical protein CPC08DRAFT_771226 [Agrocybe pediades]|nr:hypothetical protein CPC08DRAFT_771226 [Agrocybe pediades]
MAIFGTGPLIPGPELIIENDDYNPLRRRSGENMVENYLCCTHLRSSFSTTSGSGYDAYRIRNLPYWANQPVLGRSRLSPLPPPPPPLSPATTTTFIVAAPATAAFAIVTTTTTAAASSSKLPLAPSPSLSTPPIAAAACLNDNEDGSPHPPNAVHCQRDNGEKGEDEGEDGAEEG